jgi:hypothetical protein
MKRLMHRREGKGELLGFAWQKHEVLEIAQQLHSGAWRPQYMDEV